MSESLPDQSETRWVKQTKKGGGGAPPEERGDCVSACMASILGLAHPGNLTNVHGAAWWERLQADLARFGYAVAMMDIREARAPLHRLQGPRVRPRPRHR